MSYLDEMFGNRSRVLFLFLAVGLWAPRAPAGDERGVAKPVSCPENYELVAAGRPYLRFIAPGLQGKPPEVHLGNMRTAFKPDDFDNHLMPTAHPADSFQVGKGFHPFPHDSRLPKMEFRGFQTGRSLLPPFRREYADFVTPLGDRYRFRIERSPGGDVRIYSRAKRVSSSLDSTAAEEVGHLEKRLRAEGPQSIPSDVTGLAKQLAGQMTNGSNSFQRVPEATLGGLFHANVDMLEVARQGRPLALDDLKRWNKAVAERTMDGEPETALYAGLLRGDPEPVRVPDPANPKLGTIIIQMDKGNNMAGGSSELVVKPAYHYPLAQGVPESMDALLTRINALKPGSSFRDVVGIFQDHFAIHPFADGNGRTSKILFNYLLFKAGFSPVPLKPGTTLLYKSVEELQENLLRSVADGP